MLPMQWCSECSYNSTPIKASGGNHTAPSQLLKREPFVCRLISLNFVLIMDYAARQRLEQEREKI